MVVDLEREAFAGWPDAAAVVDRTGGIVAVNAAWTARARFGGADGGCGVGTDYLEVCRAGMQERAPGAGRAYADVTTVLGGHRPRASSIYPCSTPRGLRWFRCDVFALGDGQGVCVRHLELAVGSSPPVRLDRVDPALPSRFPDDGDSFLGGLAELLASDIAHEFLVVAVGEVAGADRELAHAALLARLADAHLVDGRQDGRQVDERAVDARTPNGCAPDVTTGSASRVEQVARLGETEIAVAVSAATLDAAMTAADDIRGSVSRRLPRAPVWGLAVAGRGRDDATEVLRRARQAVAAAHVERESGRSPRRCAADAARALHRCAARLADAVDEFEVAIEQGLSMPDLRLRDQEVAAAERACLRAAEAVLGRS